MIVYCPSIIHPSVLFKHFFDFDWHCMSKESVTILLSDDDLFRCSSLTWSEYIFRSLEKEGEINGKNTQSLCI